jgi:hypothetical protein
MTYQTGNIVSYDNKWAVISSTEPLQICYVMQGAYDCPPGLIDADPAFLNPVTAKYDLSKPYFENLRRLAQILVPSHKVCWVQKTE